MAWNEEDLWYNRPLSICPICKKEFAPAPDHYWKISRFRNKGYDTVNGDYRDTNVCSYTCMRKWERSLEVGEYKTSRVSFVGSRGSYTEDQLQLIINRMPDQLSKDIVKWYYGERCTLKTIRERSGKPADKIHNKLVYIRSIIRNMSDLLEE